MKQEDRNFTEIGYGYMGGLGGKKSKKEMLYLNYGLKNKRTEERLYNMQQSVTRKRIKFSQVIQDQKGTTLKYCNIPYHTEEWLCFSFSSLFSISFLL